MLGVMSSFDDQPRTFLAYRTDYQCAEIECGHRSVFAMFLAYDD